METQYSNEDDIYSLDIESLLSGNRRSLARSITLIESSLFDHRDLAENLLSRIMPRTGGAIRIGISGPPGVGKSTFIESFGLYLSNKNLKIAVLTIDPSSKRSGGSILGDKTRMPKLAQLENAIIRSSPAGLTLGGVARRTRETILLCESAGYDVVIVETVGVGQSEYAVADMVDMFVLLVQPGGGDDLQGIKRGVMELADLIIVTKSDGDLKHSAQRTAQDLRSALSFLRNESDDWVPKVIPCSALNSEGIEEAWKIMQLFHSKLNTSGGLARKRGSQASSWMWAEVQETLVGRLRESQSAKKLAQKLESDVINGLVAPGVAARHLLNAFLADD